jgi:acylpyruvate hydrolase
MKLATIRTDNGTAAVLIADDIAVEIPGVADVGELLAQAGWRDRAAAASGTSRPVPSLEFAPLIPRPDKIVCVGLNYLPHIKEGGGEVPEYPILFAKYRGALIGAHDDIALPVVSDKVDWEAELAVIVGAPARSVSEEQAPAHIAGYTVLNDTSMRDYQRRTSEFLQGKTFENSTPLGPWLVTPDEFDGLSGEISTLVNGAVMQQADVSDLLFGPAKLVSYLSDIITLLPGDVIATGTPGGVGAARKPPVFLKDGDTVTVKIAGIGEIENVCRAAKQN